MKKTLFLSAIILFLFAGVVSAQSRGFKPVEVKGTGTTTLYSQSHALVIGNSNYTNGWNNLPGVETDIEEVVKALEQNGFNVVLKQNLNKQEMDKAFSEFIQKYGKGENNRLFFYYAGHGHTVESKYGDKLGYIVPVDAPNPNKDEAGFQSKAMEMAQIEIYAKRIDSKHALFMFDACFAGSLFAMRDAVPAVINYKTKEPVRQFITSGSANETVSDKSIFRQQFVTALTTNQADANNDGYLTGTELGKFLQDNVINYSYENQHPQYGKIRHTALDKGDFVFVIGKEEQPQPQQTGTIKLITEYTGKFYLDGTYKKQVTSGYDYTFSNIPTGVRVLTISTSGALLWTAKVMVNAGQTTTIKAEKTIQYGSLSLKSINAGGNVLVDGIQQNYISEGSTVTVSNLQLGNHKAEIQTGGQIVWTQNFTTTANQTKYLTAQITKPENNNNQQKVPANMVIVKGGTFQMGSNESSDEKPIHSVTVSDFYIGKYEVTFEEYDKFCDATSRTKPNDEGWGRGKQPVINVSWYDATAYCEWLSKQSGQKYRLPTEAEWEYAARGGNKSSGYTYSGSNTVSNVAWYRINSYDKGSSHSDYGTHVVGTKNANKLGIYDMSGNVWEWCSDWYDSGYYSSSSSNNPTGASSGSSRVLRGGSWYSIASRCRVANRDYYRPPGSSNGSGFRVARRP